MSTNKEEEKYFQQLAQERREAKRRALELESLMDQERDGIAATLYTTDAIAAEALELGFSASTSRVLPLIPLIQVAWADGSVSTAEERTVLEAAEQRGLLKGSEAFSFLHSLLVDQPPARFFERVNRVIAHLIADKNSSINTLSVTELCQKVAEASGGFFGIGDTVSEEERALIKELTAKFSAASSTNASDLHGIS